MELVIKSVRKDYTSIYAGGDFKVTYEPGKTYQFDPKFPAYVQKLKTCYGFKDICNQRPERMYAGKVLLCLAELLNNTPYIEYKRADLFGIYDSDNNEFEVNAVCNTDYTHPGSYLLGLATKLQVIGEIFFTDELGISVPSIRATFGDMAHKPISQEFAPKIVE